MFKRLIDAMPSTHRKNNRISKIPISSKIEELSKEIKKPITTIRTRISVLDLPKE